MVCHSLSYYWKDTRFKVYIWQPFEARIIWTCRSGLQIKYWDLRSAIKYWDPRSAIQTVRPLVCSSNSETPGLQFKQWDPRSEAQILRTKVCGSNTESPGLHFMSCRPGISIFELQTLGLSIWTADQGSHCLNCRPGVSLFELQTCMGFDIWTSQLLCIEISPPCFLYKHLSAVLLSRPDIRALDARQLWKFAQIMLKFLWFGPDSCDLVHIESVIELFAKWLVVEHVLTL